MTTIINIRFYAGLLFLCLLPGSVTAQASVGIALNDGHVANNVEISFNWRSQKNHYTAGLTHSFANSADYGNASVFKNQAYGTNFLERVGVRLAYTRDLFAVSQYIDFSAGYALFYTHSGFQYLNFEEFTGGLGEFGEPLYTRSYVTIAPAHSLQQSLFVQLRVQLTRGFSLVKQAGAGCTTFHTVTTPPGQAPLPRQDIELAHFLSIGLQYAF